MPMVYSRNGATLLGGAAILLWSTSVALMRDISEALGAAGGAAMLYSVSTVFLLLLIGWPKLRGCSRGYLCWGGLLFVVYEICLALSLGYASDRSQAIELGMINYLWPCLTVMLAIVMNGQRAGPAVYAGLLLSLFGIGWLMCGDGTWTPRHMLHNIRQNPLSYTLAFKGRSFGHSIVTLPESTPAAKWRGDVLFGHLFAAVAKIWTQPRRDNDIHQSDHSATSGDRRHHGNGLRGMEHRYYSRQYDAFSHRLLFYPGAPGGVRQPVAGRRVNPGFLAGRGAGLRGIAYLLVVYTTSLMSPTKRGGASAEMPAIPFSADEASHRGAILAIS